MSQAMTLLNSLAETVIDHKHTVPDSDTYFLIDPYTRQIENTTYQKTVLMRGDHNSERFTFELPRYVDGHDMSLCNRVIVHFDNVGDSIENIHSDVAYTDDLRLNPDNPETVICSWLIRREATQIVGILSFSLQYQCVEDGEITYEWNTDSYDDIEIRKSKNNGEAAVIQYTNVLEQWRSQIFGAGDSIMANISSEGESRVAAITAEGESQVTAVQTESATQQAAIELKGSETLATIPEDYTEVYNMASEAVRTKADGVVCEAEGEIATLADASDDYIRGLNVYGKSTQFTTTGKNKLNLGIQTERTLNGVTLTPVYDSDGNLSYLNVNGTSTSTFILLSVPFHITAGSYTFTNFVGRTTEDGTLHAQICDSNSGLMYPQDMGLGGDFTFEEDVDLIYRVYVGEGRVVNNEKLYPMLRDVSVEDATYEPYTGSTPSPNPDYPQTVESIESPTVNICSSNLMKENTGYNYTYNGLTCEYEGDGVYHIYGTYNSTNPSTQVADMRLDLPIDPNANYTISAQLLEGVPADDFHPYIGIASDTVSHRNWMAVSIESSTKIGEIKSTTRKPSDTLTNPTSINKFWIYAYNDTLAQYTTDFRFRVWLTKSDTPMAYEPYTEQKLEVPRTLSGIPVTTGGNYTDSDGQQWICDEVDLERGVYIQRILNRTLTDFSSAGVVAPVNGYTEGSLYLKTELAQQVGLCDKFTYRQSGDSERFAVLVHGGLYFVLSGEYTADEWKEKMSELSPTVMFPLATPIETPLTAEEIEAYKQLRTNYPNTTVLNDSGAWMKIKYNADTKLYINNTVETGVVNVVEGVLNDTY